MTTPFGRQYLNAYLNQGNFMFNPAGTSYGQIFGGSNYTAGAELGMFAMNMASVFTYAFIANKTSNYEGGGGGSLSAARTDLETKVEAQLDILGEDYDVNNYTNATVEKRFTDAVELAEKNIAETRSQISTLDSSISDLKRQLENANNDLDSMQDGEVGRSNAQQKVEDLKAKIAAAEKKRDELQATIDDGGKLATAKADAVEAKSKREQAISRAKEQLNILVPKLKNEQANPVTLDAELDYSDGNWIQRQGKGENAQARQAIRDFRKAKQDYDAMPDGEVKAQKKEELKALAKKAIYSDSGCKTLKDTNKLNGSVVSGLGFIQNWLEANP